jgi:hypothetical protein
MKRLLVLVFATILFQATLGQKQKLGLNLSIGQTYPLAIQSITIDELQNANGPKFKVGVVASAKIAFTISDLKDSVYDITATFQHLASLTKLPFGGEEAFDSDKKDKQDTLSNVLSAIIDKPFSIG